LRAGEDDPAGEAAASFLPDLLGQQAPRAPGAGPGAGRKPHFARKRHLPAADLFTDHRFAVDKMIAQLD
jgi:hypothetical protein